MSELNARIRREMLGAISDYMIENGFAPSIRDLCNALDTNSTSVIIYRLQRLEEGGYITRQPGTARSILITRKGKYNTP